MADLNSDEKLSVLLGRGYLPKELPPPFTSSSFAEKIDLISDAWLSHYEGLTARQKKYYPPITSCARFDMARKGHSRRMLGVPNPINYYLLAKVLVDHSGEIEGRLTESRIGITPIALEGDGKRAVELPKISQLAERRVVSYATSGVVLQTDILSFYHSIYTHSIPWAIHGKKVAKKNRSSQDPQYYGNLIDSLLRSGQDGQTIGIPVGPDTSRIISEILLCAVERKIGESSFKKLSGGYRYMDDFFLTFENHVDAEAFLADMREAVFDFELQLNASKTKIYDAMSFNEETWPSEVGSLSVENWAAKQKKTLLRFFTEVIRIAKTHPDESIATFAVRKTSKHLISKESWELYEAFLIRMARENSNCLDSVVKIICSYAAMGYPISNKVDLFAARMIEEHAPYNHHYEVSWILWLCRSLSIKLGERSTGLISRIENSFCGLLLLMLRSRGLLTGRGAVSDWTGTVTAEDLHGPHWMLIYESSLRKTWALPGASEAVDGDPHFRVLKAQGVSFFNSSATNIPLALPNIEMRLTGQLNGRKSATLPGAIRFELAHSRRGGEYEELGEDYGECGMGRDPFYDDDDIHHDENTWGREL